jgi:hypothetical protein
VRDAVPPPRRFPSTVGKHFPSIVQQATATATATATKKKHFRPQKMWKKLKERFAKKPATAAAQAPETHDSVATAQARHVLH